MLSEFIAQPTRDPLLHLPRLTPNGSFTHALQQAHVASGLAVIAELKHASPSQGPLLQGPPQVYVEAVRRGGAACLSAVTAPGRFQGSMQTLRNAHAAGLPTLAKEFVTSPQQLDAAAHNGASAVLLIERILTPPQRDALVQHAHEQNLEVLLEVHTAAHAEAALTSKADVIGVNSRDLDTLAVDVEGALTIVGQLASKTSRPILLLSGLHEFKQAQQARGAGATGILVGTSLLRAHNPTLACRALQRSLVKVCGNQTPADVEAARKADLIGVIVDTQSHRNVPMHLANQLLQHAERQGNASVAVTRLRDAQSVLAVARALRPTFLQIHGPLTVELVAALHAEGIGVLHAIRAGESPVVGCDGTVSDSSAEGGDGHPHGGCVPVRPGLHFVAGGLQASNVAAAIASSGAVGADASSGLESGGMKDHEKVVAFIAAAQAAQRTGVHDAA